MHRDNPLYESQEIRMEMFADVSDEEEGINVVVISYYVARMFIPVKTWH